MDRKIAIVTGAASGIGKAIGARLIEDGMHLVVADIAEAGMAIALRDFNVSGEHATGHLVDLGKRDQIQAMVAEVHAAFGRIDVLVNNAGITRHTPFYDSDDAAWNPVLDIDLKAVFFCAQAVAPIMVAQRSGRIVNISSALGTGSLAVQTAGSPGGSASYASAKAGVVQLTKTLAAELGASGINVNCVAPGLFPTPLAVSSTRTPEEYAELLQSRIEVSALRRAGEVRELAGAVSFLCSDDSSFITGQTINVDGGRTDRM